MTRITHWVLGALLGLVAGGAVLTFGILALILGAPALVWAASERHRPVGLAGLLVGAGVGIGGLLTLATARCSAVGDAVGGSVGDVVESCTPPDLTPYFAVALVLVVAGTGLSILGSRRRVPDLDD